MAKAIFNGDRCKGCGLCVNACPKKIVRLSESINSKGYHPASIDKDCENECIGCAACAVMCPDLAITVE